MKVFLFIVLSQMYSYSILKYYSELDKQNRKSMRFKGYLKKSGYLIRVSTSVDGAYQIEYSTDNLKTKTVKVYSSRYEFLKALESRFLPSELKEVL